MRKLNQTLVGAFLTFEVPDRKNASTETHHNTNLVEAWTRAMEDGTKAPYPHSASKVYAIDHVATTAKEPTVEVKVYETRLGNGDEGILIDT